MTKKTIARRALLAGGLGFGAASALEYVSLRGTFDHRRAVQPTAAARLRASIAELAAPSEESSIVHVGHSTHLVCVDGVRMLTDPWFDDPAFGALVHERGPAGGLDAIGKLDAILVTHDHPDHADLVALDRHDDKRKTVVLVDGEALAARVRARGFGDVHVMAPGERIAIASVSVHATTAIHDVHEIGFVIEGKSDRVYFAGDTATHPELPAIAERHRPTFAILPVDGTRFRGGPRVCMDPTDAAEAARVLGVRGVMPSHAEAVYSDPIAKHVFVQVVDGARDLFAREMARVAPSVACRVPAPGERVTL